MKLTLRMSGWISCVRVNLSTQARLRWQLKTSKYFKRLENKFLSFFHSSEATSSLSLLFQLDRERYEDRRQSLRRFHVIPNDNQTSACCCRSQYLLVFHVYVCMFPSYGSNIHAHEGFPTGRKLFFPIGHIRLSWDWDIEWLQGFLLIYNPVGHLLGSFTIPTDRRSII